MRRLTTHNKNVGPLIGVMVSMGLVAATLAPALPADAAAPLGAVQSWGYNGYGYLGDGTTNDNLTPTTIATEAAVTQVSAGSGVLAMHADGTVDAWGRNDEGQLGAGTTSYRELSPIKTTLPTVVRVSEGGNDFGLGLTGDHRVFSFGRNYEGQLGRAISGYTDPTARQVEGLPSSIVAVSAGGSHALALTDDGHVWAWGWNPFHQLGDPARNATTYSAFQVPTLSGITAVSARGDDSYALDAAGHVLQWGFHHTETPTIVTGLPPVTSISAGTDHALAIDAAADVWAWGANTYGQIGDGTPTATRTPVRLTTLSHITAVTAGDRSSYALTADGHAWAWGVNWFGQLGDATTNERDAPIPITLSPSTVGIVSNGFASYSWTGAQTTAPTRYVALGDSYSSGEGAVDASGNASLDPSTDVSTNKCHRSTNAYAHQVKAARGYSDQNFTFAACSGALIADFVRSVGSGGQWNEGPQLEDIAPSGQQSPGTSLITLSLGGNDVGFVPILQKCVLLSTLNRINTEKGCAAAVQAISPKGLTLLGEGGTILLHPSDGTWSFCTGGCLVWGPKVSASSGYVFLTVPSLSALYQEIHKRAPNAAIRVLLYPHLLPSSPPASCTVGTYSANSGVVHNLYLTRTEMVNLNALEDQLNATITAQVQAARASGVTDIDAIDPNADTGQVLGYSGHALCDAKVRSYSARVNGRMCWSEGCGPGVAVGAGGGGLVPVGVSA